MIQQSSPAATKPLASVVVPAYNEGGALLANLAALAQFLSEASSALNYEIIIVDDGSTDETYACAQAVAEHNSRIRVVRHPQNRGLGNAIRSGFAFANGTVAVVYDSDLSYSPATILQLIEQLRERDDDLVMASPYMRGGKVANVPFVRRFLSREANRFLSFATNGRYATLTSMVRAYRLTFFRAILTHEDRMEINVELVFKALQGGARVSEVPAVLRWSAERAKTRARINPSRAFSQIWRTMSYGVRYRPAVLLALPGILPGVLPLILAIMALLHLNLKTIAIVTLITMIIQNASLVLFAGQVAVFGRNVMRVRRLERSASDV